MKMFLTRLGTNSKALITGDVTQIDLPAGRRSGLIEARQVISGVPGIQFIEFDESDVVRHPLVQGIVRAYEAYHGNGESAAAPAAVPKKVKRSRRRRSATEAGGG
jgi:phosphate starvation-inducible PhoH-like protein